MPKTYKSKANNNNKNQHKGKRNRRRAKPIPNAYMSRNNAFYKTIKTTNNSVRVKGFDLVNPPVLENPIEDSQFLFACISCNPAYWSGTRVASIAGAYSQYRPMKFNVHYFPQVSTTTNGLITAGTIWDNDIRSNAFQQTLATSNGGRIHPVYVKSVHRIALKTALSRNMFDINGFLTSDTNPFTFVSAVYNYIGIVPGYYMVEWEFEFKNPVGEGATFDSKYDTANLTTSDVWDNTSLVLAQTYASYPPGTTIQVRVVNRVVTYSVNGNVINDPVLRFNPNSYYIYRSYTSNTSNALIMRNLPSINRIRFTYTDESNQSQTFDYVGTSELQIRRIEDNLRDVPMTGWIIWSTARPNLSEGWWPSAVIRYISNTTVSSLTDFDAYIILGRRETEPNSALRTSAVTTETSHSLSMKNDETVYTVDSFAGSFRTL